MLATRLPPALERSEPVQKVHPPCGCTEYLVIDKPGRDLRGVRAWPVPRQCSPALGAIAIAVSFRGTRLSDRVGRIFASAPLPLPHLVAAALAIWVLGQSGMLARIAFALGWIAVPAGMPPLIYDRWGIGLILTMAWKEMAFLTIVATALLSTGTTFAEEAARTLGAGEWETFRRVTLPVLWRGLLPAVIAVFIFILGNYEAAALLAPSAPLALPLLMTERAVDPDLSRRGDAYVVVLLLLAMGILAVIAHEWVRARWESRAE